jgi:hypothetical protein
MYNQWLRNRAGLLKKLYSGAFSKNACEGPLPIPNVAEVEWSVTFKPL